MNPRAAFTTNQFDHIMAPSPQSDPNWFRRMVNSAGGHAILSLDLEGKIVTWNPGARRIFGHEEADVAGVGGEVIFTPDDIRHGVPEREMRVAAEQGMAVDERWHVRRDGTIFWASGLMVRIDDDAGAIIGYCKIVQDRTREKEVQGRLLEAEERYRLLQEATNDVLWEWRIDTDEMMWSSAARTHFGVGREELGRTLEEWYRHVSRTEVERVRRGLAEAIESGANTWSDRYQVCVGGRRVSVFDRGFISRDVTGRPLRVVGSMLNVTADMRAEHLLRESQARLEMAKAELERRVAERTAWLTAALSDMEAFSYSMSHDLKAPANLIRGLAEVLLNEDCDDEERQDLARRIHRISGNMTGLINAMLAYSRIGRSPPGHGQADLPTAVSVALDENAVEVEATEARVDVSDLPAVIVRAPPDVFRQMISHLLSNALKFSIPMRRPEVIIRAAVIGDGVKVSVRDNGIGVEPRYRDRLFKLFERLHVSPEIPGHGIGLASVRRMAEHYGGEVGFESTPGHGSLFWFTLPLAEIVERESGRA